MPEYKGFDISYCQRGISYKDIVEAGADFVLIRAGSRYNEDVLFKTHVAGCKAAGIPVGFYWYSYAMNTSEALQEAEAAIRVLKNVHYDYPIFFDIENDDSQGRLSRDAITEIALTFMKRLNEAGLYTGLYINPNWMINHINQNAIIGKYDIWLAHYTWSPDKPSNYKYGQTIWQWGIEIVKGMKVDGDICFVDYPAIIAEWKRQRGIVDCADCISPSSGPSQTDVTSDNKYTRGAKIYLNNANLYVSADSSRAVNTISGYYLIMSEDIVLNRIRITTDDYNLGRNICTGWINISEIKLNSEINHRGEENKNPSSNNKNDIPADKSKNELTGQSSIEDIARRVLKGEYGNQPERQKRLEAEGYNYAQVQAAVNRILYG